jgi:predicted dehydrogenase
VTVVATSTRAGIVGTGFMGGVHARAIRAAGAAITQVSAQSLESARRGAHQMGSAGVAESAEELIHAEDVDVVHVCTPNHLHASIAEQALRAGKHVVCEKPLATTGDAAHLAELADWCDLMEFVTGHRIVRLTAATARAFDERISGSGQTSVGTEDGAAVLFQTDLGATGSVVVSQVSPGRKNRLSFSFDGPDASYLFDSEAPDSLVVGGRSENRVVLSGPDTLRPEAAAYATVPSGHPQGQQDCFNAVVADTYAAIGGDRPDGLPTFADGYRAATLTAAVVESAQSQTWVDVAADPHARLHLVHT